MSIIARRSHSPTEASNGLWAFGTRPRSLITMILNKPHYRDVLALKTRVGVRHRVYFDVPVSRRSGVSASWLLAIGDP
jgi:hypothetical protein